MCWCGFLSSFYLEFFKLLGCLYSLIKFGKFLAIISSDTLSAPFSFSSSGTCTMCMLIYLTVSHRSLRLCSLQYFFFLFLRLDNFSCPIFSFTNSLIYVLKSAFDSEQRSLIFGGQSPYCPPWLPKAVCKLQQEHMQGCLHRAGCWVAASVLRAEIHLIYSLYLPLQVCKSSVDSKSSKIVLPVQLLSRWVDGFPGASYSTTFSEYSSYS